MADLGTANPALLKTGDRHFLHLLAYGPFLRRPSGGWQFGTRRIANVVVDRLIANGSATREGDRVWLSTPKPKR